MKENKKIYYFLFPFIILGMIALLLFFGSDIRNKSYLDFQKQLAKKSVTGASNELGVYISELRRSVRLFAAQEQAIIRRLAKGDSNLSQYQLLEQKVNQHFPEHFSFTIASKQGEPLLDGLDSLVGGRCKRDIASFLEETNSHRVYVHSSPFDNPYHFDVMVPWGDNEGIFFISFNLKNITQTLKNAETIGHSLLLLKNDTAGGVELTAKGSTKMMEEQGELDWFGAEEGMQRQRSFHLSLLNKARIEYELPVIGTLWTLVDIPDLHLYSSHKNEINMHHGAVFMLFCFVISVMTYFLFQANNRLLLAMNDLHIANNQKDKLFSVIGHDLRTPFMPIQFFSNSLIKKTTEYSSEEIIERANIIHDSSKRALALLEQLLEWASLQNDGYPMTIQAVKVKEIAIRSIDLYGFLASEKNCTLRYETEDIMVYADTNALDTIIRNLVSNAIKFTEHGVITIGAIACKGNATIYVKDTGIGMDRETTQKIFSEAMFYTTEGTSGEQGTGLGLSLCKGLALKQNSQIAVESVLGKGSTFYITLPRVGDD